LAYLLLILVGAVLAHWRFSAWWVSVVALNAWLFCVMSLDYRLRANEFYMLFWLNAVFLAGRARRWTIPLILISFYFWAGRLKLNYEWLSGSVLYHDLWLIPRRLTPVACAYVVVLEMVMVWGLLSRRRLVRWMVLGQLACFHIESLSQIHWFYPALMATMLAWFVFEEVIGPNEGRPTLSALLCGKAPKAAYITMVLFALFQVIPFLYRGDVTLNGQGRMFALHMFEARQVCEVSATLHYLNRQPVTIDLTLANLPPRMICDPIVYYDRIENICRAASSNLELQAVDFVMKVKRTTDQAFTTIIAEPSFCSPHRQYSLFANNSWIR
jgi:hypothetical protein